MSGKGTNGLSVGQNLKHLNASRGFENPAEPVLTKCAAHPTKRMWTDHQEAAREAKVRTVAAQLPIVAYICDECHNAHLCKKTAAHPGTIIELAAPERNWEVFAPARLGNPEAIRKQLAELLQGRTEITSVELREALGVSQNTVMKYMSEAKWYSGTGRSAKWRPKASVAPVAIAPQPPATPTVHSALAPIDLAQRRHPSAQPAGWMPMENLNGIQHIPLGDVLAVLKAAGLELRVQTRQR